MSQADSCRRKRSFPFKEGQETRLRKNHISVREVCRSNKQVLKEIEANTVAMLFRGSKTGSALAEIGRGAKGSCSSCLVPDESKPSSPCQLCRQVACVKCLNECQNCGLLSCGNCRIADFCCHCTSNK